LNSPGEPSIFRRRETESAAAKDTNLARKLGSSSMRVLLATSILASILISSSITAEAGPLETAPPLAAAAPTVHVQRRAEDFNPHSAANRAEQRRLSRFDAKQEKLNEALDKKLNICRC
jgi:hypothetical protein